MLLALQPATLLARLDPAQHPRPPQHPLVRLACSCALGSARALVVLPPDLDFADTSWTVRRSDHDLMSWAGMAERRRTRWAVLGRLRWAANAQRQLRLRLRSAPCSRRWETLRT